MKDRLINSVKLLIAVGSFVAEPKLLSALKSAVSSSQTLDEVFENAPPSLASLADELTQSTRGFLEMQTGLPEDVDVLYEQMVFLSLPDANEIIEANMDPVRICDVMLAKLTDIEHTREPMVGLYKQLTIPILEKLIGENSFVSDLMPAWMRQVLDRLDQQTALIDRAMPLATQLGMQEEMVIGLARIYTQHSPNNFIEAYKLLDYALRVAAEERGGKKLPENMTEAIAANMARVDELNDAGNLNEANDELEKLYAECKEEQLRQGQVLVSVIQKRINQSIFLWDIETTAKLTFELAAIDQADSDYLSTFIEGFRNLGENFDRAFFLEVAVAFADLALDQVSAEIEQAEILESKGKALQILGEKGNSREIVARAISTYDTALEKISEEVNSYRWASVQNSKGTACSWMFMMTRETSFMQAGLQALGSALSVRKRSEYPREWAQSTHNLGVASYRVGKYLFMIWEADSFSNDSECGSWIESAIGHYSEALSERRADLDAELHLTTQKALGSAHFKLGEINANADDYRNSAKAYWSALRLTNLEKKPAIGASLHRHISVSLLRIAVLENDSNIVEQAITGFELALAGYHDETDSVDISRTMMYLADAYCFLGDLENDRSRYETGVAHYRMALENCKPPRDGPSAEINDRLGYALMQIAEMGGDVKSRLEEAVESYQAVFKWGDLFRSLKPLDWACARHNLGLVLHKLGSEVGDSDMLGSAIVEYEKSLEVWTREGTPLDWATARENIVRAKSGLADYSPSEEASSILQSALGELEALIGVYEEEGAQAELEAVRELHDLIIAQLEGET